MTEGMLVTKKINESWVASWAHGQSIWVDGWWWLSLIWGILEENPFAVRILIDT